MDHVYPDSLKRAKEERERRKAEAKLAVSAVKIQRFYRSKKAALKVQM